MTEMPGTVSDGDLTRGRTVRRKDRKSFIAYDLRDAREGDMLAIRSIRDVHILMKEAANEHDDALQNWRLLAEREIGSAVKLVLLEPNEFGSPLLTRGIVLKEGMELGVVEHDGEPRSMKSLGIVAGIACVSTAVEPNGFSDMQLA